MFAAPLSHAPCLRRLNSASALTIALLLLAREGRTQAQTNGGLTAEPSTTTTRPGQEPGPTDIERRFLRVESSFWRPFGLRLSVDGRTVGPGVFAIVPDEAIRGSETARRHAVHARIDQGIVIGSAAATVGLLIAAVAVRAGNDEWTPAAQGLGAGALFAFASELFFALLREKEFLATVNAYNYDVVTGKLGK
jgi:hypothetical protein